MVTRLPLVYSAGIKQEAKDGDEAGRSLRESHDGGNNKKINIIRQLASCTYLGLQDDNRFACMSCLPIFVM